MYVNMIYENHAEVIPGAVALRVTQDIREDGSEVWRARMEYLKTGAKIPQQSYEVAGYLCDCFTGETARTWVWTR
jgi:hypothetical protein